MEVGGLVVSVVGVAALATLFHDCIESFDCFRAADKDFEGLLVELDMEKARLLYWGNEVGILNAEGEGQATQLKEDAIARLIERALKSIKEVLADANALQQKYGVRVSTTDTGVATMGFKKRVSSNLKNTFDTSWTRFCIRSAGDQQMIKRLSRARWAIHDKGKFEALIIRLRTRISGLRDTVPINKELEDQTIQEDIASIMNISQLRLVESVCEGPYPRWAERASTVREATESGTVDRRHIEEWLRDSEEVVETMPVQTTQRESHRDEKVEINYKTKLFFVLSSQCLNIQGDSTCDQNTLGNIALMFTHKRGICIDASHGTRWSLGRRIARQIDLSDFTYDMDAVREYRLSYRKAQSNDEEPRFDDFARLAKVYIYCAPCACLVHAAIDIGEELGESPELEIFIRVDERLVASCCSTASRINGLSSICQEIRDLESRCPSIHPELDRDWIEQRVFSSEEEKYRPVTESQVKQLHRILDEHRRDTNCAAIIILGEIDYCSQMMRHPSFPQSPRMPRETEIYMMKCGYDKAWSRNYVGTYVPNPSAVPNTQSTRINSSLTTAINLPGTDSSRSLTNSSLQSTSAAQKWTDTTQISVSPPPRQSTPPPSPDAKRQRTSVSSQYQEETED